MDRIANLVKTLAEARAAYYNTGTPVMTDAAYDSLEDELRRLDPTNAFFAKVGTPAPVGGAWPKVRHTIPMGSLNKAQNENDMRSWFSGCGLSNRSQPLVIMDKLDGLSLSIEYVDRRLSRAITRGDGTTGEDITRNVLLMKGAVKVLPPTLTDGTPTPSKVYVRGEMVVTHADFKAHFPGESNPRNTASGTSKRQSDNAKCAYVTFMAYNLMPNGVSMASKTAELHGLAAMGFHTPKWSIASTLTDVFKTYADYIGTIRKDIGYDIDGLVVEINDTTAREALGDLNDRPRGSIAFKFPHDERETILRNIRWQVGNSGRLTPVAEFDPVMIGGASVKQASLATARNVQALKLFVGCRIVVSRRNDCIPYLESNLDEGTVA